GHQRGIANRAVQDHRVDLYECCHDPHGSSVRYAAGRSPGCLLDDHVAQFGHDASQVTEKPIKLRVDSILDGNRNRVSQPPLCLTQDLPALPHERRVTERWHAHDGLDRRRVVYLVVHGTACRALTLTGGVVLITAIAVPHRPAQHLTTHVAHVLGCGGAACVLRLPVPPGDGLVR